MMNTANVTATAINAATTATIMKTTPQQPMSLQQSGIIPATIITANERLTNVNSSIPQHHNNESVSSVATPSLTAFTIHAPTQSLQAIQNNLVSAGSVNASVQPLIQTVSANTSIIHPATIGNAVNSSVVCTAAILPAGIGQQITTIPVAVTGPTVSVLKAQPSVTTLPIGQRFQTNVMNSSGPTSGPINALFIHRDPSKNQTIAHSASNPHHQTHIQSNSVINATVSVAGPTVTVHQPIPSAHNPTPLFIQTSNPTPNNAILHTNVGIVGHANSVQPTNLSTINLTTSAAVAHQQSQQQQQQFQRLKVEDALSYLDQVKFKFNDQPQVYNDFLDIMKEFKSQSIDTPGVIQRVSNLFKGHPELIVGFNTFLPPGYKIEIHSNDQVNVSMPNSTSVVLMSTGVVGNHQPTGVVTSTIVTGPGVHQMSGNLARSTIVTGPSIATNASLNILQSTHPQTFTNSIQTRDSNQAPATQVLSTMSLNQSRPDSNCHTNHRPVATSHTIEVSNSRSPLTQVHLPSQNTTIAQPPQTGSQPVEFNHAINYVNKIKNRFQQQPEIYKQFLDILQSYQKEQLSIKEGNAPSSNKFLTESEVFTQVAKLFQNQEDLLQEFGQFLPDANSSSSSHGTNLLTATAHSAIHNQINSTPNSTISNFNLITSNQPTVNYSHNVSNIDGIATFATANSVSTNEHISMVKKSPINVINSSSVHSNRTTVSNNSPNAFQHALHRLQKRPASGVTTNNQIEQVNSQPVPVKRSKIIPTRDSSIAEAGKYMGDLVEYAFFDKLRVALNCSKTYEDFLRCMSLYNNGIISKLELIQLVTSVFPRTPELLKRFKEMLGVREGGVVNSVNNNSSHHNLYNSSYNNSYSTLPNNSVLFYSNSYSSNSNSQLEGLSHRVASSRDRRDSDYIEPDFNSCKRYGVSYRTIPKSSARQECSGRTQLCREVLNDTLVSFPSWSEDSTFVSSRKTQYEEYIYRCEDERYELDLVLETNMATLRVLEVVMKKMERMTSDEKANFKLDDTLGGTSKVVHQKSIRRIYGDKACSVIEGLKNSPAQVVPIVIRRLVAKEEEWREAQKQFNKIWREQNEKYYLKSLDHQGISFKQNDIKYLRSKSLLSEIENIFDERHEQQQHQMEQNSLTQSNQVLCQPHMVFVYPDKSMIEVACNLIIHHVKRQTSIHKEDKQKIKQLMRHFIPDLFSTPRGELSDDELDEDDKNPAIKCPKKDIKTVPIDVTENKETKPFEGLKPTVPLLNTKPDEEYSLFFVNNNWYLFFRLHCILCERLSKIHKRAQIMAEEEANDNIDKINSPSTKLRLKNNLDIEIGGYFSTLVDMVKQVLDGNLDATQYEDTLREMFGIHAYITFTLDKVVQNIVRQLQHIVGDEVCQQCTDIYLDAIKSDAAGGLCITSIQRVEEEATYQKNAEQAMSEENCFKVYVYKNEGKISIELLESAEEEESTNDGDEESNSTQSSRTLRSSAKNLTDKDRDKWDDLTPAESEKLKEKLTEKLKTNPLFLERCVRKFKALSSESKELRPIKDEKMEVNSKEDDDDDDDDDDDNSNEKISNKKEKECKFSLNNYKHVLVVQNDSVLYRRNAIPKSRKMHRAVTQSLYNKFSKWYSKWVESNCSPQIRSKFDNWLVSQDTTDFTVDSSDENNNNDDSNNDRTNSDKTDSNQQTKPNEISSTSSSVDCKDKPNVITGLGAATTDTIIKSNKDASSGQVVTVDNIKTDLTVSGTLPSKLIKRLLIAESETKTPYRNYCKYQSK